MRLLRNLITICKKFNYKETNSALTRRFSSPAKKYDINLDVKGVPLKNYIEKLQKDYEILSKNQNNLNSKLHLNELQPVIEVLKERKQIVENIENLMDLLEDKDEEIRKMAQEEEKNFENKLKDIDKELFQMLIPVEKDDLYNSIILEVNTGVGGQEAMLFAKELLEMYSNFIEYKGWESQIADYQTTDLGGIRHASLIVNGPSAFRYFKHEAGVHRVQRIPATEKGGRIHTSTVSVVALPQPSDIDIKLENKDLKIETKRASGAGGQHVNTTDSAVRIHHIPTGLSVECQVERSQHKNKEIALTKLRTLLYQKELEMQIEKSEGLRKSQVKSSFRNEKIRTYNFPQDRVTDHRIGMNIHNLKGFLVGGSALETLIKQLDEHYKTELLLEIVKNKV